MSLGVVITAPAGEKHVRARSLGGRGCSNEAETLALIEALQWVHSLGGRRVVVFLDSRVVIDHVRADAEPSIPRLEPVYVRARELLAQFDEVTLTWIPRRKNAEADALARSALRQKT